MHLGWSSVSLEKLWGGSAVCTLHGIVNVIASNLLLHMYVMAVNKHPEYISSVTAAALPFEVGFLDTKDKTFEV